MKILTIWQPWASLLVMGIKRNETRSRGYRTNHSIVIHAAKRKMDPDTLDELLELEFPPLSHAIEQIRQHPYYGMALGVADSMQTRKMVRHQNCGPESIYIDGVDELERALGLWQPNRFALSFERMQPIYPVSIRGKQGLFDPPSNFIPQLRSVYI